MEDVYTICLNAFKAEDRKMRQEFIDRYVRCAFYFLCVEYNICKNKSLLARFMGKKSHATVLSALKKFDEYYTQHGQFKAGFDIAEKTLKRHLDAELDAKLTYEEKMIMDLRNQVKDLEKQLELAKIEKDKRLPDEIRTMLMVLSSEDIQEFVDRRVRLFIRMKLNQKQRYRETYGRLNLSA